MNAVYDLLKDIQDLSSISTAGDVASLKTFSDKIPDFLDAFRTHLLTSLEQRKWNRFDPRAYVKDFPRDERGCHSKFLQGLRDKVFDSRTGRILQYSDRMAVSYLYQTACFLDKFGSSQVTESMRAASVERFMQDEQTIRNHRLSGSLELIELARELLSRYFLRYVDWDDVTGRHGPGAVAEGRMPFWEKYTFNPHGDLDVYWPQLRLENPLKSNFATSLDQSSVTSRMCFVPKNRRKCRIICAEPSLLQYLQQGLRRPLYRAIAVSPIGLDLTDQTVNAQLALESSSHGYYATLDLRSASDLLSLELVGMIFPTPMFARMAACRSQFTTVTLQSTSETIALGKFGSMGNALTFPVQTLVFWSLIAAARMLSGERERNAVSDVWVYGDDIICPRHSVSAALHALESVGLEVNRDKSFWNGDFRESCGIHAYNGIDVTPAYLRTWSQDPESMVSMCATARLLDSKGYSRCSSAIYSQLESWLRTRLPYSRRAEGLARYTFEESELAILKQNLLRGIKVSTNKRNARLETRTFGFKPENQKFAVFNNSWDMWDYIGPHSNLGDRDRGIVASGKRFTHITMPLC